jgi:hypothetical protein
MESRTLKTGVNGRFDQYGSGGLSQMIRELPLDVDELGLDC